MQQRDAEAAPQAFRLFVPEATPRPRSTQPEENSFLRATRGILLCAFNYSIVV